MHSEESGTHRICVTNAKGGTGKTTIAINLAGALNRRGRDVLFVDADPQGNATEGLGMVDAYDAGPPTIFDALTDPARRADVDDLLVEHREMTVLPSNIALLQAERELTIAELIARLSQRADLAAGADALSAMAMNVGAEFADRPHALGVLDETLAAIDREFDYVVIDSPPFYGKLTDACLYAARNVLVPALTEATSERAIELLIDQIAALESQADISVSTLGVVANRVETTAEDETMIRWLETVFAEFPLWEVRKRVALQRAFSAGVSIFEYDDSVDMADVFMDMATTLDTHSEPTEVTA